MKNIVYILIIVIPCLGFGEQYSYGLGIVMGFPTGLSGEFVWSRTSSMVFNAGWSLRGDFGLHITGTYQFMFPGVVKTEEGDTLNQLVPYLGIGGRILLEDSGDDSDVHVGIRTGGGVEYFVERFGMFIEVYPVVDVVPETKTDFEGVIGFRFYL